MFALIAYETLYFKVDDGNRSAYEAAGLEPFTYTDKGKPIRMPYHEAPSEGFDDPTSSAPGHATPTPRRSERRSKPSNSVEGGSASPLNPHLAKTQRLRSLTRRPGNAKPEVGEPVVRDVPAAIRRTHAPRDDVPRAAAKDPSGATAL